MVRWMLNSFDGRIIMADGVRKVPWMFFIVCLFLILGVNVNTRSENTLVRLR